MINIDFENRLKLFDLNNKVEVSSEKLIIEEKIEDGKANLTCDLTNYSISFRNADKNIVGYFKNQKCADSIIFQRINENDWKLIVIEFKRTLSIKNLTKSIEQFIGAIHNSLALAGVLGIKEFKCVEVYSAYRNEKISPDKIEDIVTLKDIRIKRLIKQWQEQKVKFDFIDSDVYYGRIELDDLGNGKIVI